MTSKSPRSRLTTTPSQSVVWFVLTLLLVLLAGWHPAQGAMAKDPSAAVDVRSNLELVPAIEPAPVPSNPTSAAGDSNSANGPKDSSPEDDKKDEDRHFDRDLVQIGQSVHVLASEKANDVVVVFGDATIDGTVEGRVVVVGGTLTVKGTVSGDCVNVGMGIKLEPTAHIKGDVTGVGGGVTRADGAQVDGRVVPIHLGNFGPHLPLWISQTWEECVLKLRPSAISVPWTLVTSVIFILLYTLIGLLFPGSVEKSARRISERGISSIFVGLLAIPSVAFFLFFMIVSVIFIPIVPLVTAPLVFGAMIGKAALLRQMGVALFRPFVTSVSIPVSILVGGIILAFVYMIPVIGLFAWALTLTLGFGAFVQSVFGRNRPVPAAAAPVSPGGPPGGPIRPTSPTFPMTPTPVAGPSGGQSPSPKSPASPSTATSIASLTTMFAITPSSEVSLSSPAILPSAPEGPKIEPSPASSGGDSVAADANSSSERPPSPTPNLALALAAVPSSSPQEVVTEPTSTATPPPRPATPNAEPAVPPSGSPISTNPGVGSGGIPRVAASNPPTPPPSFLPLTPAELLALPRVGLAPRLLPLFFDWLIISALIFGPILDLTRHDWLCGFLELGYFAGFYLWRGATPMGLIFGLRVVRLDGRPLDIPCVLVRGVAAGVGAVAAGIGYFWCAWDPEKQTWHDKLAGTVVVKTNRTTSLV